MSVYAEDQLWRELWVSLASLLRSYTAAHGLNRKEQATVELGEEKITVRTGVRWLRLDRNGNIVNWTRENNTTGILQLTLHGTLKAEAAEEEPVDEEMDMRAEAWARELMQ